MKKNRILKKKWLKISFHVLKILIRCRKFINTQLDYGKYYCTGKKEDKFAIILLFFI